MVTFDEIKYIFQVAYQLLYRITDLDLVGKPFQAAEQDSYADYGSQAEVELLAELYGAPPQRKEHSDSRSIVQRLQDHPDIQVFFKIFQVGKIVVVPAPEQSPVIEPTEAQAYANDQKSKPE